MLYFAFGQDTHMPHLIYDWLTIANYTYQVSAHLFMCLDDC